MEFGKASRAGQPAHALPIGAEVAYGVRTSREVSVITPTTGGLEPSNGRGLHVTG